MPARDRNLGWTVGWFRGRRRVFWLRKLATAGTGSITALSALSALLSVVAITAGALLQKWLPRVDLRSAACVQNVGGTLTAALAVVFVGTIEWDNTADPVGRTGLGGPGARQ